MLKNSNKILHEDIKLYLKINESSYIETIDDKIYYRHIGDSLNATVKENYCGIITPIINDEYIREFMDESLAENHQIFTKTPLFLDGAKWRKIISYVVPPDIAVTDDEVRQNNIEKFKNDLSFAIHCALLNESNDRPNILLRLSNRNPEALGKLVREILEINGGYNYRILVELPMVDPIKLSSAHCSEVLENDVQVEDQWSIWNRFYRASGDYKHVSVALVMMPILPSNEEINRWIGDKVSMIILPRHCFEKKSKDRLKLRDEFVPVVKRLWEAQYCKIAFETSSILDIKLYSEIINDFITLFHTRSYKTLPDSIFKYLSYKDAIIEAVYDFHKMKTLTFMVVAPDWPLNLVYAVHKALKHFDNIYEQEWPKFTIVVAVKNSFKSSVLQMNCEHEGINLKVLSNEQEMIMAKQSVDFIVTEIIGNFAPNEMSLKALASARQFLKPGGIIIPENVAIFLRPIMSMVKLNQIYASIKMKEMIPAFDVGWKTDLKASYTIDEPKRILQFSYLDDDVLRRGFEYNQITFTSKSDCVLNGLVVTFSAFLYKDIKIGNMIPSNFVWHPKFLQLFTNDQLQRTDLKAGESFDVEVWRYDDDINAKFASYSWRYIK